ncbi:thermonuclease family protein [Pseudalkalibacillus berkeleyi]|uniref:Thermonuclease family protein n=1 Tax=Pseudalkalibacillus berkeleyi TaxID=1069813 RepID=A0ABS9H070_9BACL|nr:thermonuclease family protein [Pseudalkalibacillus berkeleyi]MCF6137240.1 thermonuclease family protein [Pseudalkalibacillus berkeleyi]
MKQIKYVLSVLFLSLILVGCSTSESDLDTYQVTKVIDGDTIKVNFEGQEETVRLLLIDTPETVHPNKPVEPFGNEASQYVKNTILGKNVQIKLGSEKRDKYGRLLAYVYVGDETIQEQLLRKGLARTAYLYNDLTMLDQFHKAQNTARLKNIGVWSIKGYAHVDHNHGYHYEPKKDRTNETSKILYDPNGPDRDCGDFNTQQEAQRFMDATGPNDPHRLDGNDNDGLACERLP